LREGEEGRKQEADEERFHGVRELTRGGEVDLRRWDLGVGEADLGRRQLGMIVLVCPGATNGYLFTWLSDG
jgi:hypothetical protein